MMRRAARLVPRSGEPLNAVQFAGHPLAERHPEEPLALSASLLREAIELLRAHADGRGCVGPLELRAVRDSDGFSQLVAGEQRP